MRIYILILAAFIVMMADARAQEYRLPLKEIQTAASEGLVNFSKVIAKQNNYREMGFESPNELGKMALGEPLQIFMIPLDELKKYKQGQDVFGMLRGGNHVLYPVLVNNQIRSSVTVAEKDKRWKAVSFGSPLIVKMLDKTRMDSREITKLPSVSYFVVEVPALNLFFIAYRDGVEMLFTPVMDDEKYGFKSGGSMPAGKVLTAIVPAAVEHDGLPR